MAEMETKELARHLRELSKSGQQVIERARMLDARDEGLPALVYSAEFDQLVRAVSECHSYFRRLAVELVPECAHKIDLERDWPELRKVGG